MLTTSLLVLARALHVFGGVVWAGATFVLALAIIPIAQRDADSGGGRWMAAIAQRVGPASGIAAILTILSGIYLFATLHPHDTSASGVVLQIGAGAAILSMLVSVFISRPAGQRLGKLQGERASQKSSDPELASRLAALRKRVMSSVRLASALLAVAILAMGVFRYVPALG